MLKKEPITKKKVIHIYGTTNCNSGDYLIGIATKKYFSEKYLNNEACNFVDFNCRQIINDKLINFICNMLRKKLSNIVEKYCV